MMTSALAKTSRPTRALHRTWLSPNHARLLLVLIFGAAISAVVVTADTAAAAQAASAAGVELTRLLRAMAVLKALLAVGAASAVLWRLGAPVALPWFAAYLLACGATAAGPALIWNMAHVGAGALLVHAGLLATFLLLWRDPMVADRLAAIVVARRSALNSGR